MLKWLLVVFFIKMSGSRWTEVLYFCAHQSDVYDVADQVDSGVDKEDYLPSLQGWVRFCDCPRDVGCDEPSKVGYCIGHPKKGSRVAGVQIHVVYLKQPLLC